MPSPYLTSAALLILGHYALMLYTDDMDGLFDPCGPPRRRPDLDKLKAERGEFDARKYYLEKLKKWEMS